MRLVRWALLAAALLAAPALALPLNIQPRGTGGGTPTISSLTGAAQSDAAVGSVLVTPTATLPGCSWSIAAQSNFAQAAGGAVTKAVSNVAVGTYTPLTTCTLSTGGQTVLVSANLSISITTGAFTESLDFSDARNSQYLLLF